MHRHLGPGLLESSYLPCLQYELRARRLDYVTQRSIPLVYKELSIEGTYRIDSLDVHWAF